MALMRSGKKMIHRFPAKPVDHFIVLVFSNLENIPALKRRLRWGEPAQTFAKREDSQKQHPLFYLSSPSYNHSGGNTSGECHILVVTKCTTAYFLRKSSNSEGMPMVDVFFFGAADPPPPVRRLSSSRLKVIQSSTINTKWAVLL